MPHSEPPIATATVAHLYMEQGRLEQAERLYRALLQRSPDDERLKRGLAEVQRRQQASTEGGAGGDRIEAVLEPGGTLRARWSISEQGRQQAILVLEAPGNLVLRVVPFPARPDAPPVDLPLDALRGEMGLPLPAGARALGLAVGLVGPEGSFASISHSPPVLLPGAGPGPADRG